MLIFYLLKRGTIKFRDVLFCCLRCLQRPRGKYDVGQAKVQRTTHASQRRTIALIPGSILHFSGGHSTAGTLIRSFPKLGYLFWGSLQ